MKKLYYFAYGSNLCSARLKARCEHKVFGNDKVRVIGTHNLYGWKLVFNCGMGTSFANIIPGTAQDYVEGVLYDINARQIRELDWYEGLYDKEYFIAPDGNIATVYISTDQRALCSKPPTLVYINTILDGCLEHGLRKTYNELCDYKRNVMGISNSKHKPL